MRPVWLAAAVLLAAYLVWRRRRVEPTMLVGGGIAAIGAAAYGLGLFELPDLDELLKDVGSALGAWTYLLVGVLCFLESGAFVGLLVPGETAIVVGGFVAGQGEIDIVVLIAIVWTTAVAGDLVSFALGRRLGREFLVKHGPRFQITEERLQQVERFYDRHGGKAVFLGRWVGLVRAVSPFVAASSGMPLRRFLPYDVLAAGAMGTAFCLIGYVFWHSLDQVLEIARKGLFALGTTIVVVVALIARGPLAAGGREPRAARRVGRRARADAGARLGHPRRPRRRAAPRAAGALRLGSPHAGSARTGADDAAVDRGGRQLRLLRLHAVASTCRRS